MKRIKRTISLLLMISLLICSSGFSTLAVSLYGNEISENGIIEQLKEDLGEEKVKSIIENEIKNDEEVEKNEDTERIEGVDVVEETEEAEENEKIEKTEKAEENEEVEKTEDVEKTEEVKETEEIEEIEKTEEVEETEETEEIEEAEETEETKETEVVEDVEEKENEATTSDAEEIVEEKIEEEKVEEIEEIEKATVSELDELNMLSIDTPMFTADPNNVYWYLKNSDTELHLSGTLPSAPEYIAGQDNYNGACIGLTERSAIVSVVFDNPVHPTNCNSWFMRFENLLTIENISYLDTSEVINMSSMFYWCKNLTSLDVSNFDTTKVTNMASMFHYCETLTSIDVSGFNTSKVTDMNRMFSFCEELVSLDVSNFNTSEVTNMSFMFSYCKNISSLDVNSFNTSKVTDMSQMFLNCYDLTSVDVSNFNTSEVTNMSSMFNNCSSLTNIDVTNFDTSKVTHIFTMFNNCSSLTSLDVSNFDTRQVTNIQKMFDGCTGLTYLDLSSFIINPAAYGYINNMLANCANLKHIKISESVSNKINETGLTGNWKNVDTKQVYYYESTHTTIPTNLAGEYISSYVYWYLTNSDTELHLSGTIPTAPEYIPGQDYYNKDSMVNKSAITKVVFDNTVSPFDCESWFNEFVNLTTIEYMPYLDTSEVVNMTKMFYRCSNLISFDVSNFDTSEVTNMSSMFQGCNKIEGLNVSNFVTTKVTDMNRMFSGCHLLRNVNVSNFDTSKVTNMSNMFFECDTLMNLNVSNFVTNKVTDMSHMFNGCNSLTNLDVSNFVTSEVTNMSSMFSGCNNLTNIDVSNFNTSKVTYIFSMFKGCSGLTSLDVRNFDTRLVTNIQNMFDGCTGLTYLDLSSFTIDPAAYSRITNMLNNCKNLDHIKISTSVSMKINELNLTGNWKDVNTGVIYNYDGSRTTIPTGTAGEYTNYHVYWYLTDGDTRLHLSGIKPTATQYVSGHDSYDKNSISVATKSIITRVIFDSNVNPYSCEGWFQDFRNLINIEYIVRLNTSEVTNMESMFDSCINLITLVPYAFDTSKVTNMKKMFFDCKEIGFIDVSNFDTRQVINMESMFSGCRELNDINVSGFDTSKVTNMSEMFNNCNSLTSLDLSNFVIDNTEHYDLLLSNCDKMEHIKISSGISNVVNDLGLTGDWKNVDTNIVYYYDTTTTIPVGAGEYICRHVYWYLKNSDTELHLSGVEPIVAEYVTGNNNYSSRKINTVTKNAITKVVFDNTVNPISCAEWFRSFYNLSTIEHIDRLDTSEVASMGYMFYECNSLANLDVSGFNTNKTTSMSRMFCTCQALTNLDVSGFDTSNVTDMSYMFGACENLENLDVSNFVTNKVTDMYNMFYNCKKISILDVSGFDTSNALDMSSMFYGCENLDNLDLSNFVTNKVTNMMSMFSRCSKLTNIDVSSFNTNNVTKFQRMFYNCSELKSLDLSSLILNTSAYGYIGEMIADCTNLKHIKISQTLSNKINEVGLTGDWADALTGIIYYYDGTYTTIPTGVAGEYGRPLTISFETNGGTLKSDMVVAYGSKIAKPTDVIKSGYTIENWYKEAAHTNAWNFDNDVAIENMTLHANWIYATYTIRYNANGGSISPTQITKTYNTNVSLVSPTKIGYDFYGWYTDNNTFLNLYDGTTDLADTQDAIVNIYAKWLLNSNYAEVKFNSTGGSAIDMQVVEKGVGRVTRPTNPIKVGYEFVDWYKEPTLTNIWNFATDAVNNNITLYAKWKKIVYTVTFNTNGGTSIKEIKVNKGATITKPTDPTKHGYTFISWYKEASLTNAWNFKTDKVNNNITLYAKWIKNRKPSPSGGGGGGGGISVAPLVVKDPLKENAILACDKNSNTYIFSNESINWIYDPIKNSWGINIVVDSIANLYKYGFATIDNHTYYFDENGNMATGWVKDTNGDYYAFEWEKTAYEGMMLGGWRVINDKWYFFQENGKLLINNITPDGYIVDMEGVWVK